MRITLKATMIGLMAIVMGLLIAPNAKSGSSCGSSTTEVSNTEKQEAPDVNQDIIRLEELSSRLAGNISQLEEMLSGIIDGMEEDQLRMELEAAERLVAALRSEIVDYQVLSLRVLASAGHDNVIIDESPKPATNKNAGCNH